MKCYRKLYYYKEVVLRYSMKNSNDRTQQIEEAKLSLEWEIKFLKSALKNRSQFTNVLTIQNYHQKRIEEAKEKLKELIN